MKFHSVTLLLMLLVSCGRPKSDPAVKTTSPEDLQSHSAIFSRRIEKVGTNIYMAIGYGLANSILIEGRDSVIIVDCMESIEAAQDVKHAFDSLCHKPVKAIIYTHFHTDHTSGGTVLAGESHPDIYAQELLPHLLDQTSAVVRNITEKRSYRMFGVYLDEGERVNCGIGPELRIHQGSELGILKPTVTFRDSLHLNVSGIHLVLYHAPGETPDQLMVWLPDEKALLCGDNLYHTFPNLYTIRGTGYRDVNLWRSSLDRMRYMRPEYIIPSHTEPLRGADSIYSVLTDYRDAIAYIHDQTVRGMNAGLTPDELCESVILPAHLRDNPWLQEFYGKTAWSVRTVFDGYMGFFDGNPTTLMPLKKKEHAAKIEALAGGQTNLGKQIDNAATAGEWQWVLELTDAYLALYPAERHATEARVKALTALGMAESNPNARHYYLTCAKELQGLKNDGLVKPTPDLAKGVPLASIFNGMAAHLNPDKSREVHKRVLFHFSDSGSEWTVEVRRGVAEVQPFDIGHPDLTITIKEQVWKELAAKIRSPLAVYASGDISISGGQIEFLSFMRLFDIE